MKFLTKIRGLFLNANVRLAARALAAGAVYAFSHLYGHPVSHTLLVSVLVAAGWTALEVVTPLNVIVGWFRQAEKIDPALKPYAPPTLPAG